MLQFVDHLHLVGGGNLGKDIGNMLGHGFLRNTQV